MASHVQVVLREDVEHLGHTGEVVRVRPGYARNYLIPRGLATMATRASIRQIEHDKAEALKRAKKQRSEAEGVAAALNEVSLTIAKQAGAEGKLYGSVTSQEVAALLESKGYAVDRRKIVMPDEAIKAVGDYQLGVKLAGGVHAAIKLQVVAEG